MRKARRVAARRVGGLRIMFADEARFGRMNRPRPCWAPDGTRPQVACQLVREYVYLYGAVSPKDGTCVYLIMPAPDTQCFQIFLETLAKKYPQAARKMVLPRDMMLAVLISVEIQAREHHRMQLYLGRRNAGLRTPERKSGACRSEKRAQLISPASASHRPACDGQRFRNWNSLRKVPLELIGLLPMLIARCGAGGTIPKPTWRTSP